MPLAASVTPLTTIAGLFARACYDLGIMAVEMNLGEALGRSGALPVGSTRPEAPSKARPRRDAARTFAAHSRGLLSTRRIVRLGYLCPVVLGAVPLLIRSATDPAPPWVVAFDWGVCVGTFLIVYSLLLRTYRKSLRRRHTLVQACVRSIVTCFGAMMVLNVVRYGLRLAFPQMFLPPELDEATLNRVIVSSLSNATVFMVVWGGIFLFPLTYRRAERRRTQVAVARREAEILRLRAHLDPHFFLNTLNTIAGLVTEDPSEARRMIGLLGDLFRDAAHDGGDDVHALGDEIAWLERYAAIHESRHSRMVRFTWHIDDDAKAVTVPRLVLQPLVENAVLHGILRNRQGGTVSVRARIDGDALVCVVEDDGPGFPPGARRAGAQGLSIVERRLRLFSSDASLSTASEGGVTCVTARLPVTTQASA